MASIETISAFVRPLCSWHQLQPRSKDAARGRGKGRVAQRWRHLSAACRDAIGVGGVFCGEEAAAATAKAALPPYLQRLAKAARWRESWYPIG